MSTRDTPKGPNMATRNPTTTDRTETQPTLPTTDWTLQWPAFDRDHDPEPLTENDPTPTKPTTLADFGGLEPADPERPQIPTDTRDRTRQTSVFEYPREWWRDADRLEALFDERGLAISDISDLLGDDVGYEGVRSNINDHGVRNPETDGSMAAQLAGKNPEDLGLSPSQTDDSHAKFTKRGERA